MKKLLLPFVISSLGLVLSSISAHAAETSSFDSLAIKNKVSFAVKTFKEPENEEEAKKYLSDMEDTIEGTLVRLKSNKKTDQLLDLYKFAINFRNDLEASLGEANADLQEKYLDNQLLLQQVSLALDQRELADYYSIQYAISYFNFYEKSLEPKDFFVLNKFHERSQDCKNDYVDKAMKLTSDNTEIRINLYDTFFETTLLLTDSTSKISRLAEQLKSYVPLLKFMNYTLSQFVTEQFKNLRKKIPQSTEWVYSQDPALYALKLKECEELNSIVISALEKDEEIKTFCDQLRHSREGVLILSEQEILINIYKNTLYFYKENCKKLDKPTPELKAKLLDDLLFLQQISHALGQSELAEYYALRYAMNYNAWYEVEELGVQNWFLLETFVKSYEDKQVQLESILSSADERISKLYSPSFKILDLYVKSVLSIKNWANKLKLKLQDHPHGDWNNVKRAYFLEERANISKQIPNSFFEKIGLKFEDL